MQLRNSIGALDDFRRQLSRDLYVNFSHASESDSLLAIKVCKDLEKHSYSWYECRNNIIISIIRFSNVIIYLFIQYMTAQRLKTVFIIVSKLKQRIINSVNY